MYQQVISSYTYTTSSPPTQMHTCLHTRARATPPLPGDPEGIFTIQD